MAIIMNTISERRGTLGALRLQDDSYPCCLCGTSVNITMLNIGGTWLYLCGADLVTLAAFMERPITKNEERA